MNFRKTARRMMSDWYKNKKRAGSDSPKNFIEANLRKQMEGAGRKVDEIIKEIVTNSSMGDHFAYFDATPLCGSCAWPMRSENKIPTPGLALKWRVRCKNPECRHNGILYEVVPEKSAVIVMRRVDEKKTE